jgi:hypothetical protein
MDRIILISLIGRLLWFNTTVALYLKKEHGIRILPSQTGKLTEMMG